VNLVCVSVTGKWVGNFSPESKVVKGVGHELKISVGCGLAVTKSTAVFLGSEDGGGAGVHFRRSLFSRLVGLFVLFNSKSG